jgi:RNA polymerase sigma factor (sigma-70 family)
MANGLLPLLRYLQRITAGTPGGDLSDGQLLQRFVRHQDEAAFTLLVGRHARMVWGVCSRVLHDSHAAEDAFQATFVVLLRKAGSIAHGERLASWLYGVALRVAQKARVQAARRLAHQKEMRDMPDQVPTDATTWHELSAVLDGEVRSLPARYREPMVLCYLKGLSNEEAARQLGCPEGTLRSWLTRAREMLRQRLQRRGLVLPGAALASLLAENAASAAVPAGLVDSTLTLTHTLLVTGQLGLKSAAVATLSRGVLKDMVLIKVKIAAAVLAATVALAGSGWFVQQALAHKPTAPAPAKSKSADQAAPADNAAHASKLDLNRENLAKLRAAIQPQGNEWRHLKIHWYTDIVAARKKAAAEDRPILVFRTGGAGYNDPLGQC